MELGYTDEQKKLTPVWSDVRGGVVSGGFYGAVKGGKYSELLRAQKGA